MSRLPKKVTDRLSKSLSAFQKVLKDAYHRDVNESDTVTIVTDMLSDLFGYDKYSEVTSEQSIRGTYCDLAVVLDREIKFLIEVKAIGMTLKEGHLRQALNYGANQGIPWVVLTNGVVWDIRKIKFEQPISHEQVCTFQIPELSARRTGDQALLYLLCKEGQSRNAIENFHKRVSVLNRFTLAALLQSEPVLSVLRRELRRLNPDLKISADEISELLPDVLKRDTIEGDVAMNAHRKVGRAVSTQLRQRRKDKTTVVENTQAGVLDGNPETET
jgi:predicted type IV restriction endonuclease